MNRGHIHSLVAQLIVEITRTGNFYGWVHKQSGNYQTLLRCSTGLSVREADREKAPKAGTLHLLKEIMRITSEIRKNLKNTQSIKGYPEKLRKIDRARQLVNQELRILQAAETLKNVTDTTD